MNMKNEKKDLFAAFKTRSFRVGGYSVAATALVLAIAMAANFLINALPAAWTQIDTSAQQLSTISDQTIEILDRLDEKVELYWICQSGREDSTLENLLNKYAGQSSQISVSKKDPNSNPAFIQQYVTSGLANNSVIVVSGDRYRYVAYDEIFVYDLTNYYTDGSYTINFDGESALTSAIAYVTSEDLPKVYTLSGHGEYSLSTTFSDAAAKENMELESLSLISSGAVPEDADAIMIYSPETDISSEEKELLLSYLNNGGNLYYISNPAEEEGQFANIEALMAEYGMSSVPGIVVEADPYSYANGGPLYLLPTIKSHAITEPLVNGGYYIMLPIAHGIQIAETLPENVTVDQLLRTSASAYSKIAGYNLMTLEKEEGDLDGAFVVSAAAENSANGSSVVWVTSYALLEDSVNQQVSGANQDFFLNTLGWMCDYEDTITIHSKSMDTNYLTIDNGTAGMLTVIIVGLIPAAYLCAGIATTIRRRKS